MAVDVEILSQEARLRLAAAGLLPVESSEGCAFVAERPAPADLANLSNADWLACTREWDRAGVVVRVRDFGDGLARVSADGGIGGGARAMPVEDINEHERARTKRRAVNRIFERCLFLRADVMATLTYHANQCDRALAMEHFRVFVQRMIAMEGAGWKCVAVAERQKRGAIHFHVALRGVNGFVNLAHIKGAWITATGETYIKQVQVEASYRIQSKARLRGDSRPMSALIAGYLSKYLTKGLQGEDELPRYGHHYYVSRGLTVPVLRVVGYLGGELHKAVSEVLEAHGVPAMAKYRSEHDAVRKRLWGQSW